MSVSVINYIEYEYQLSDIFSVSIFQLHICFNTWLQYLIDTNTISPIFFLFYFQCE